MVRKGFLFTLEGIIAVVIILMSGLYIYKIFLAVKMSKAERLEVLGSSVLETLDKRGTLPKLIKQGNYSGLERVIEEKLGKEVRSRLNLFSYQVVTVDSGTKIDNWPVEISLNFPESVNKRFIKVFDSDMKIVPHQIEWNWYRVPVIIENGNQERTDWPIRIDLNFTGHKVNNVSVAPDEGSIRVFTDMGEEIPSGVRNWECKSTNCSGSVVFLVSLEENESKNLFVYYSVGTMKEEKEYPDFPEFHLLNDTKPSYFFRQWQDVWEVAPYNGTDNGTVHYEGSKLTHSGFWDNHTSLHLYREDDTETDSLIFAIGGSGGENCNWTSSRANFSISKYPSQSRVTKSDDPCSGDRNEFNLSADPEGSWGGPDWDGGVLELPNNWTIVELEQPRPYDDFYWYSRGDHIIENLTGADVTVYGHPPNITYSDIEKAPRADLVILADLENSSTYYVKFSVGTSKIRQWEGRYGSDLRILDTGIENSFLEVHWDEDHGATISEIYYKNWSESENLAGPKAFDLPVIEDANYSEEISPWYGKGNFSVIHEGPMSIVVRAHSEIFNNSNGHYRNITRDAYYKLYPESSLLEVKVKYKFLGNVTQQLTGGDEARYPTSSQTNRTYFDKVTYIKDSTIVGPNPLTAGCPNPDTSNGSWVDEWDTAEDFGLAQIGDAQEYSKVYYCKNEVNDGQLVKYWGTHSWTNGTEESYMYWWYFHPGDYEEGNVSELAERLTKDPEINVSTKYNIPDGTNITETVFPGVKSIALSPYFVIDNDTFAEVNLLLWYKI